MAPDDGDADGPRVHTCNLCYERLGPHDIEGGHPKKLGRVKSPRTREHLVRWEVGRGRPEKCGSASSL